MQRKTAELAALREGSKSEAEFARQAVQEASARASAAEAAAEQLRGATAKLKQQLEQSQEEAAAAQESAEAGYAPTCTHELEPLNPKVLGQFSEVICHTCGCPIGLLPACFLAGRPSAVPQQGDQLLKQR